MPRKDTSTSYTAANHLIRHDVFEAFCRSDHALHFFTIIGTHKCVGHMFALLKGMNFRSTLLALSISLPLFANGVVLKQEIWRGEGEKKPQLRYKLTTYLQDGKFRREIYDVKKKVIDSVLIYPGEGSNLFLCNGKKQNCQEASAEALLPRGRNPQSMKTAEVRQVVEMEVSKASKDSRNCKKRKGCEAREVNWTARKEKAAKPQVINYEEQICFLNESLWKETLSSYSKNIRGYSESFANTRSANGFRQMLELGLELERETISTKFSGKKTEKAKEKLVMKSLKKTKIAASQFNLPKQVKKALPITRKLASLFSQEDSIFRRQNLPE